MRTRRRGLFVTVVMVSLLALTVGTVPLPGLAADHLDAPALAPVPRADIGDLYAFEGSDAANTVLAMTVSPGAGVIGPTNFGNDTIYTFNIDNTGDFLADIAYTVFTGVPLGGGSQDVQLFRSEFGGETAQVASGLTNQNLAVDGGGTFFAGLRSDPFFFDLAGFQGSVEGFDNGRAFNDGNEADFFADLNVLALVLEVPDSAVGTGINVWATTDIFDGVELARADRMGRPAINTVINSSGPLIGADPTAKDIFNQSDPFNDDAWVPNVEAAIAILSSLDSEGAYDSGQLAILSDILLPDVLFYDTGTPAAGPFNGRRLQDDVIDIELNILTGGEPFPGRDGVGAIGGDGIGAHTDYLSVFPYLGPPHSGGPAPRPATTGVIDQDSGLWYLVDPILADLTGDQEVPGPGDAGGSGTGVVTFNTDTGTVCFDLNLSGLSGTVTAAHIHDGPAGTSGPVVVNLDWPANGDAGCVDADQALIDQILADLDRYYINVHTDMFPAGAVRGQLGGGPLPPFFFGNPSDDPFLGDWDGDGIATPGLYRRSAGKVFLRNSNTTGIADIEFFFGNPGDIPLIGDWDGDGDDTVSIYRPSLGKVFITNELGYGGNPAPTELDFFFGNPFDTPIAGDFDGDGKDTVGIHRNGRFFWRNTLDTGPANNLGLDFGDVFDEPMFGDWDGDGLETPGVYRPASRTILLRNSRTLGIADMSIFADGFESGDTSAWSR